MVEPGGALVEGTFLAETVGPVPEMRKGGNAFRVADVERSGQVCGVSGSGLTIGFRLVGVCSTYRSRGKLQVLLC